MAAGDWNFLAGRLQGDGSIEIIETELPLSVSSLDYNLSSPSAMDGTIENEVKRLKNHGRPVFEPWNTVIIAEASDTIRGMTIYQKPTFNGRSWTLDQIGFPGYALNMPYDGDKSFIDADPLDMFRHVWEHLQSFPQGNLGITVDDLKSPVRVGTPEVEGDSNSGPRRWSWWDMLNLGPEIDKLAKETPFDWIEDIYWLGDQPRCHIRLGYPTIGGRDDGLRFVLGENLATEPTITESDFANQVWVLGAGEGRDRIRGMTGTTDGRLRRVRVRDDKSIPDQLRADMTARDELRLMRGELMVDTLEVYEHPNAPLRSIELGNEYPLYAETDHVTIDAYVRVVGKKESPQTSDQATLTVVRTVEV